MIDLEKIASWIIKSNHKKWCERDIENLFSSGGECNCGKEEAIKEFEKLKDRLKKLID